MDDSTQEHLPNAAEARGDFRSLMTFGTGDGRPSEAFLTRFYEHALALSTTVPIAVQTAFMALDHDMSDGSDHLLILDGLVTQVAAEIWAAERIVRGKMAPLTAFHHSRALYEAHAIAHWLLSDVSGRWLRLMKDHLLERNRFEAACDKSIGKVATDISAKGRELLADDGVRMPPSVFDQAAGDAVLLYDYAIFWKYASSHLHPSHTGSARATVALELALVTQLLAGTIRHASAVYRHYVVTFNLAIGEHESQLAAAEEFARYRFQGAPHEPYDPGTA